MQSLYEHTLHNFFFSDIKINVNTRLLIEKKNKEEMGFSKKLIISSLYFLNIFLKYNLHNCFDGYCPILHENFKKKKNYAHNSYLPQTIINFWGKKFCCFFFGYSEIRYLISQINGAFFISITHFIICEFFSKFILYYRLKLFFERKTNKIWKINRKNFWIYPNDFKNIIYFFLKFCRTPLKSFFFFTQNYWKFYFLKLFSNRISKTSWFKIFFAEEKNYHAAKVFSTNRKKNEWIEKIKFFMFKLMEKTKKKKDLLISNPVKVFYKINSNLTRWFSDNFFFKKSSDTYKKIYESKFTFFLNEFSTPKIKIIKNKTDKKFCFFIFENFQDSFHFGIRIKNKRWTLDTKYAFRFTFDRGILNLYMVFQ